MAAKRPSTTRKRPTARRRTTARRRHPARRVKIPRSGPLHARLSSWLVLRVVVPMVDTHQDVARSKKDAAILRATHKGCPTCNGNGQIYTKNKKTGEFTGAKPCPAKPTQERVSKWEVYKASRFGPQKRTGLIGWTCPCGKKEKPRYRDSKAATAALRTHERQKHGGTTVGGRWYAQATDAAVAQHTRPETKAAAQTGQPVSKVVTNSGMTDAQWIAQNKKLSPGKALNQGLCWKCAGTGKLYGAFGGDQIVVVCTECGGNGKARAA
ncbi:MAG: hypothetical protein HOZ81_04490 [Streptomyces sp.]|nr:hypothetical protein [Streptomyces sp.]